MTCAKRYVRCEIVTPDGEKFMGTNVCANPQRYCPRQPGEDYEKCKSVCQQHGHAEIIALSRAKEKARGAIAWINHDAICGDCLRALAEAGIARVEIRIY